ncbi:MAG: hypothetical protein NDF54_01820 [archaeon GB-1867-035]|nr:hypothetical protein [Candidatus Culexmicrobium profundum]
MEFPELVSSLIAAALTLMIYSLLYRENILYRIAEHTFVGIAAGYGVAYAIKNIMDQGISRISAGNYWFIIPIIFGIMLFFRFTTRYAWVSRYAMAVMVGVGTGVSVRALIEAQIVRQIKASTISLYGGPFTLIDNAIIVIGFICSFLYFFFTDISAIRKPMSYIAKVGRYVLMFTFGGAFGGTVLSRMTLFTGRMRFLLSYPAYYMIPVFIVILGAMIYYDMKKKE